MQNNVIKVPLKNGMTLAVSVYGAEPGCNNDEICVGIIDTNGCYLQDIALVRESLDKEEVIEAMVYGDTYNEDYTDRYEIGIYHEECEENEENI